MFVRINSILVLVITIAFNSGIFAQTKIAHQITPLSSGYKVKDFDEAKYRDHLFEKYKSYFEKKRTLDNFIDILTEDKKACLNIPDYENWKEATEYVSKVAHKVMPESYFTEGRQVNIIRSPEVNAYCFADGSIYITIGMLAILSDEAELASVLSHEYGHMVHEDTYKTYIAFVGANNSMFNPYGSNPTRGLSKEMMAHETNADTTIVARFNHSGYNFNSAISIISKFKIIEDFAKKSRSYVNPKAKYIQTHPVPEERIKTLKSLTGLMNSTATKRFQIDSMLFFKIRTQANDECIYLEYTNKDYFSCLYDSFKNFAKDPNDEFYAFFVLESLRRLIAANKNIEKKVFITSEFYVPLKDVKEKPTVNATRVQSEYGRGITYNYDLLYPFNPELKNVKTKYTMNDTLEFVTNIEAYKHLYDYLKPRCQICNYTYFIADPNTNITVDNFDMGNNFQKILFNELKERKNYNSSSFVGRKVPIYLNDISVYEGGIQYNQLMVPVASYVREMFNDKMATVQTGLDNMFYQKLNFCDLNSVKNSFYFLESVYNDVRQKNGSDYARSGNGKNKYTVALDYTSIAPDQFGLATRYNYNKVVWVNIFSKTKVGTSYMVTREKTDYYATVYCMDLTDNSISSLDTEKFPHVEYGTVFTNKITVDEFKTEHEEVFNYLFNQIIFLAEKLIKN